jgi:hypothetical protein
VEDDIENPMQAVLDAPWARTAAAKVLASNIVEVGRRQVKTLMLWMGGFGGDLEAVIA